MTSFYNFFSFLIILGFFSELCYSQDSYKVNDSTTHKTQDSEKIIHLIEQSKIHLANNDTITLAYGIQALEIAKKTTNETLVITCYNQLLYSYFLLNDIESAKDLSRQAERTVLKTDNIEQKAKFFLLSGQVYNKAAEFKLAEFYLKKSMDGYLQIQKTDSLYTIYLNLAKIHQNKHEYDTGVKYAYKSLKLAESKKNLDKIAKSKKAIGEIYADQKKFDIALELFFENLKYFERVIDTAGISQANNDIALTYFFKGENKLSISYSKKSLALRKLTKNKEGLAESYNNLSLPYSRQKNWNLRLYYLNKSLELFVELNELRSIPIVLINIGNTKLKQGLYIEAIKNFEKAFDFQKKDNKYVAHLEYNKNLYKIFSKKAEFQKALNHYKLYNVYKDSIAYDKQQNYLSEIEIQYESKKKENQLKINKRDIKLLRANQKIKNIEINNQKILIFILISSFIIILFFLILVFTQMIRKNKAYNILVEKNLEIVSSEKNLSNVIHNKNGQSKNKENDNNPHFISPKYVTSQLSKTHKKKLLDRILATMEKDKPYQVNTFTLNDLAKSLDTSRSYISQVINEGLKKNFNQFINEYRVKDARKKLSDPSNKNLTIEYIASSVGFGSKSSFNKSFKDYTGITPTFYLKSLK